MWMSEYNTGFFALVSCYPVFVYNCGPQESLCNCPGLQVG
jgi:hypothetical protein